MRPFTLHFSILLSCLLLARLQSPGQGQRPAYIEAYDSITLVNLPELILKDTYRQMALPESVDNSTLPYFRPIFSQIGASCGQASSVGYTFTYEMCRERNLPASDSNNQYPSHFVYNFNNYNSWYGVNYMHSFEVLRTLGSPTLADYGGMAIDEDGLVWISGYDSYYEAMKNRVRKVSKINVGTPEGLLTLKHWLLHHLEGSPFGGIANFNAASPWGSGIQPLPAGTPEAGEMAVTLFPGTFATHAMTIVGYNDSIRFDYNDDEIFTNHLDINNDGVVDMRDWEIGGLKFANSYGDDWQNEGFCYMMYKTLAENVFYGGIWNSLVHVIDVREEYEPMLTARITLKHNLREQIRLVVGLASETSSGIPEQRLYFPVFNFQGGPNFMQGGTDEEHKTIEIGLDISPLLSYADQGSPVAYFLEVYENDPNATGSGEIISFSLMDYTNETVGEISCGGLPADINHNEVTRCKIIHTHQANTVTITTEEIPVFDAGFQLEATNGTAPLQWTLETSYHQQFITSTFPEVDDVSLSLEQPNLKYARQTLDFSFPFYGESFDEVFVHKDGFILFEPGIYPWPYYKDTYLLFRSMKNIAAFLFTPIKYYPGTKSDEGIWYEGDENRAAFRWKQPLVYYDETIGFAEFAVVLFPDGSIEYYYNDILVDENILWYSGVSAGDNTGFKMINGSHNSALPLHEACRLSPETIPDGLTLSTDGFLSGILDNQEIISNVRVMVTDDNGITDQKDFRLSDQLLFALEVNTMDGKPVHQGSSLLFDLVLTNRTGEAVNGLMVQLTSNDTHLLIDDNELQAINLPPYATVSIPQAFSATVASDCPDQSDLPVNIDFSNENFQLSGSQWINVIAPAILLQDWLVDDNDNHYPDPGETAPLVLTIKNQGTYLAKDPIVELSTNDPYLSIHQPVQVQLESLQAGSTAQCGFTLAISEACPTDHEAILMLKIMSDGVSIFQEEFSMNIGQYPVLLFNKAKNDVAVSVVREVLDSMNIEYVYTESLPERLDVYRSVFACLGSANAYTALTVPEGEHLADYLDKGGRMYMEGGYAWNFSVQTPAHLRFRISGQVLGNPLTTAFIQGVAGTFAEGIDFPFHEEQDYLFIEILPLPPAFALMHSDADAETYTMVGNAQNAYKTVGSQLEFRNYGIENDLEERKLLMKAILTFFDMGHLIISVPETPQPASSLQPDITVTPNPFSDQLSFRWTDSSHSWTEVTIYSREGVAVRTIQNSHDSTLPTTLNWDGLSDNGSPLTDGMYIARFNTASGQFSVKLIKSAR